jgi:hypothetical protein
VMAVSSIADIDLHPSNLGLPSVPCDSTNGTEIDFARRTTFCHESVAAKLAHPVLPTASSEGIPPT